MDSERSSSGRHPSEGKASPELFAALGRAQRHFRFGRGLLIGLGIAFIVGAVALVAYKAITESRQVFQRRADQIDAVRER